MKMMMTTMKTTGTTTTKTSTPTTTTTPKTTRTKTITATKTTMTPTTTTPTTTTTMPNSTTTKTTATTTTAIKTTTTPTATTTTKTTATTTTTTTTTTRDEIVDHMMRRFRLIQERSQLMMTRLATVNHTHARFEAQSFNQWRKTKAASSSALFNRNSNHSLKKLLHKGADFDFQKLQNSPIRAHLFSKLIPWTSAKRGRRGKER